MESFCFESGSKIVTQGVVFEIWSKETIFVVGNVARNPLCNRLRIISCSFNLRFCNMKQCQLKFFPKSVREMDSFYSREGECVRIVRRKIHGNSPHLSTSYQSHLSNPPLLSPSCSSVQSTLMSKFFLQSPSIVFEIPLPEGSERKQVPWLHLRNWA